jgi:hypothetical protein
MLVRTIFSLSPRDTRAGAGGGSQLEAEFAATIAASAELGMSSSALDAKASAGKRPVEAVAASRAQLAENEHAEAFGLDAPVVQEVAASVADEVADELGLGKSTMAATVAEAVALEVLEKGGSMEEATGAAEDAAEVRSCDPN